MNLFGTTISANEEITFTPYFITPDGMKVYGYATRTYTANEEITEITSASQVVSAKFGNPDEINEKYTNHLIAE